MSLFVKGIDFWKKHTALVAVAFLVLIILVPYWKLATMQGYVVTDDIFTSDIMNEAFPYRLYIGEALKHGEFPTWLPYIYGGIPLLARAEAGVCYPLNLVLFGLLNPYVALNIVILLTLITAALGMYLFARELKAGLGGSLVAAVSFAYSGFMVSHLKHLSTVGTVCWFPFGLLVLERAVRTRRPSNLLWIGAIIGLQNLSGHIQTAYYSGLVYLCYFVARTLAENNKVRRVTVRPTTTAQQKEFTKKFPLKAFVIWFCASGLIGIGISAVQLLPTYELVRLTQRSGGVSFEYAAEYAYDPANVKTFFYPAANGEISNATYTGKSVFWEDYGYAGLVTLLLALLAAIKHWRLWHVRFFVIAAVAAYLLVLGPNTPVYKLAFDLVPGLNYFRFPTRFLFVVDASFAVLAAIALSKMKLRREGRLARPVNEQATLIEVIVLALVVGDLLYFQMSQNAIGNADQWSHPPRTVEKIKKDQGLYRIYSPGASEVHKAAFAAAHGWEGSLQPYIDQREFVQPSANVLYDLFSADGYAQLTPSYVVDLWGDQNRSGLIMSTASATGGKFIPRASFVKIMNMCNVKYILSPWTIESDLFTNIGQVGDVLIYENPSVLPRAYIVGQYRIASGVEAAKAMIVSGDFDPSKEVVIYEDPHAPVNIKRGGNSTATVENYGTNEVIVKVSSDSPGLLVLSDTFYPGWRVEVDGNEVPVLKGNLFQRVVAISSGHHTVRFFFDSLTAKIGAIVTVVSLTFLVGIAGSQRHRKSGNEI